MACGDERVNAHDARTVSAYDSHSDVFLWADPNGKTPLAAFSVTTNKWEVTLPVGPAIPTVTFANYRGYFDPIHNTIVVDGGPKRMWVYRSKK